MGTIQLAGKKLAAQKASDLKATIAILKKQNIRPTLSVIEVGDEPSSRLYLDRQRQCAAELGIRQHHYLFSTQTSKAVIIKQIRQLNRDSSVNAILVVLPLPEALGHDLVQMISPEKDVDGMTATSLGRLWQGNDAIVPSTAAAIMTLLMANRISLIGQRVVIIGRSQIVAKPLAALMLDKDATVTIAHSKTRHLADLTRQADILVCDVGQPGFITGTMVKKDSIVIDVGINFIKGRLVGDVVYHEVAEKAAAITPVPGGIGPLTIICLMSQVVALTRRQNGR